MRRRLLRPLNDVLAGLERLADAKRPGRALAVTTVALVVTWFVYVPIHELLHAAGCVAFGGEVSRLEIAPQYGGALVAKWFPFVVSGGEYAGRLTGFDTKQSALIYLAMDFAPYLLSVLFGVCLLRICTKRTRPIVFGAGIVIGLAPFYNLPGDYFEMGSVIVTRVAGWITGAEGGVVFAELRSDDVFRLLGKLFTSREAIGLSGAGDVAWGCAIIFVSFDLGIVLAIGTYMMGDVIASQIVGQLPQRNEPVKS